LSNSQAVAKLQGYLTDDEKLLWAGKPNGGIKLRPVDWFLMPISFLFLLVFGGIGIRLPGGDPESWFLNAWLGMVIAMGLFALFGRFLLDAKIRTRQTYGVTNRRLLIETDFLGTRLQSLSFEKLPSVILTEGPSGTGHIGFAEPWALSWLSQRGPGLWMPALNGTSFEFIDEARRTYNLILSAQTERRR